MTNPIHHPSRRALATFSGAGLFAALLIAASYTPGSVRLWGYDGLAYFSIYIRFMWIVASAFLAGFYALWIQRGSNRTQQWIPLLILLAVLLASYLFPDSTSLRGDGILLSNDLASGKIPRLRAPLSALLLRGIVSLLKGSISPKELYRIYDLCFFALYLFAAYWYIRRQGDAVLRGVATIAFALNGTLLLSAGLIEYYAPVHALTALSLLFASIEISRKRFPWLAGLTAIVATGFHLTGATLLPAFLLVLTPRIGKRRSIILYLISGLAGLAAFAIFMRSNLLFPIGPHPADNYFLWSTTHWIDLFNLLGWALPVVLFVLVPLALTRRFSMLDDPTELLYAGATLGTFGFALVFSPDLGLARDADLASLIAVPSTFWIVRHLARSPIQLKPAIAAAALFVGLLGPGSMLVLHSRETSSAQRFVRMLRRDPIRSAYGWESLAIFLRWKNDPTGQIRAYEEALKVSPNWRYAYQIAILSINRGDFATARHYAQMVLTKVPDRADAYWLLGNIDVQLGQREEGMKLLREAIDRNIHYVTPYTMLAYLHYEDGNSFEAERILIKASQQTDQLDALYFGVFTVVEDNLGKYSAAVRLHESIGNRPLPDPLREEVKIAYHHAQSALASPGSGNK